MMFQLLYAVWEWGHYDQYCFGDLIFSWRSTESVPFLLEKKVELVSESGF